MKNFSEGMLVAVKKAAGYVIDQEKAGQSFCPMIFHQPKRPKKNVSETKASK